MARNVPKYDPKSVGKIESERGVGWRGALRIASTTMDGAYQRKDGSISSTQTGCDALGYPEHIGRDSAGKREGRRATTSALRKHFGGASDLDGAVDDWIRKAEGKRSRRER